MYRSLALICASLLLNGCMAMTQRNAMLTLPGSDKPVTLYFASTVTSPVRVHGISHEKYGGEFVSCGGTLAEPAYLRRGRVKIDYTCPREASFRSGKASLEFARAGRYYLYCMPDGQLMSAPAAAPDA